MAQKTLISAVPALTLLSLVACGKPQPLVAEAVTVSTCTSCHGDPGRSEVDPLLNAAPPSDTSGRSTAASPGVGAHQAHLHDGALRAAIACSECHAVPTDVDHARRPLDMTFGPLATRDGAAPSFLPSTLTCSATYCHGATLDGGGTHTEPRWTGGAREAACGSCHLAPPPSHSPQSTHCNACHPGTVKIDGSIDVGGGLHINGTVDVQTSHPAGWAARAQHGYAANAQGLAACKTCHGSDLAGGITGVSCNACHAAAGWAGWQSNCTFCHGTRVPSYGAADLVKAAPPVGTQGQLLPSDRAVGAHQQHLSGGLIGPALACTECHTVPGDLDHLTGSPGLVAFGPGARRGNARPSWDGDSCSASYCHGGTLGAGGSNTAPRWTGGPSQATCLTCHGAPPPSHAPDSSDCNRCHPGTVRLDGAIDLAGGLHIDGIVEVLGGHPPGWSDPAQHGFAVNAQGFGTCKSCHGADLAGGTVAISCADCHAASGFPSWSSSCTFCHGDRASGRPSPPVDTRGRSDRGNVSVGAHAAHVGTTLSAPVACGVCHPARGDVIADAAHIDGDGQAEVAFGGMALARGAVPAYDRTGPTQATCSSTYCHGSFPGGSQATMSWTSAAGTTCASCHGAPPDTGRHGDHLVLSCGDCHEGSSTTTVNPATHLDGVVELGNGITYDPITRACVGCHGAGTW